MKTKIELNTWYSSTETQGSTRSFIFFPPSHTNVNLSEQLHASPQSFTQSHAHSQSQVVAARKEAEEEEHTKIKHNQNFDADEDVFSQDELLFTGKRISASENLMFQQEVIMSPKYYKMTYERIDKLSARLDHPLIYINNEKILFRNHG